MLVIDEAHLTVQWGRHFRPEFQLLSSLRDQLQEASPSGIKTLLLSATLTQDDTNVLKNVFSSELFTEFRGDELRTEPVFYTHECESEQERTDIIRHLVALAPRPIILYVATLDQARDYNELLRNEGYRNCACFTGDTADEKKADLLESWRQNKLDIMVATSAFGMGVDKADIRTIITAYIPESISRYYQEVGRAGRDGYASINYWLPFIQEDQAVVHHLTKSAVLTEELLAVRWSSLLHAGTHDAPDEIWLNMYHAPEHLKYSYTGEKNKNWNIDTVLFMSRCKLIDILDTVSTGKDDYRILVRLLQIPVLIDTDTLISYISQYRESERHMIEESMAHVRDMIHNPDQFCYADYFVQDFPYSASQCSGCPACRAMGTEPYYSENIPEMHTTKKALYHRKAIPSDDLLPSYLQYRDEILLVTDHTVDEKAVNDCIALLIRHAVNIIIYPPGLNLKSLINRLAQVKESNYLLLTLEEADSIPPQWLDGCCALFYTKDSFYNQRLYAFHNAYLKANKNAKVVHIAPPDTYVPSRKKQLIETVDCSITFASIF